MRNTILFIATLFVSLCTNAFSIDSMVLVSERDGNGVFTLTSTQKQPEYIKGEISQVRVIDGNLEKFVLTKDNIPMWDLAIIPTKMILNPGERRRVAVKNLCQHDCQGLTQDKVYQIEFTPAHTNDSQEESQIGIQMGYAPYFIIPAEISEVNYDIEYNRDKGALHVNNQSNTLLYLQLDACVEGEIIEKCKNTYTMLAGRIKDIDLSEVFIGHEKLKLKIATYDYSYNETEYVSTK